MIAETLSLDFVGDAAGLQDAVLASQRALQALNRDTSRFSFSIGRVMRTIVTPIASIILSAFAAKKALADFTQSGLPGVSRFNQTLGVMRLSMFRLSSAVGELLAPMAERTARIITRIADSLEPIVRRVTAAVPIIAQSLRQFGTNLLAAFRPLMPTVFGTIDGIVARFNGADWGQIFANVRDGFLRGLQATIEFAAPIVMRLATLFDSTVRSIRQILGALGTWISSQFTSILATLGIDLGRVATTVQDSAGKIQAAILTGIASIEVAIQNWPMLFDILIQSARVAAQFLQNNWLQLGKFIVGVVGNAVAYMRALLESFGAGLLPFFKALASNIGLILSETLVNAFETAEKRWRTRRGVDLFGLVGTLTAQPYMKNMVSDEEIALQNPYKAPDLSGLKALPPITFKMPPLMGLPEFGAVSGVDMRALNASVQALIDKMSQQVPGMVAQAQQFGAGMGGAVVNALGWAVKQAVAAQPAPRIDRFAPIGPLLFGSREAAMRESNQGSKNPLVPIAQQQLALTREQLVQQRAAARAAERKARIANF